MKRANLALLLMTVLCLTAALVAQQSQQQPLDDNKLEDAHGTLFSPPVDKAGDASKLTKAVTPALPSNPSAFAVLPHKNFVDDHILGRMERDHIPHAALSDDSEFLRRVYIDATGLLPTADEARAFLADKDPNKRDKLIDTLIGSEPFADEWAYHFDELFRTRQDSFHLWTKEWLRADRPYSDVFYDMVTPVAKNARGLPTANTFYDATAYISGRCVIWTDPDHLKGLNRLDWIDEMTTDIGRTFLGVSVECFSCHNGAGHADTVNLFLASKKRVDFWQQAAFFGKLRNVGISTPGIAGAQSNGGVSLLDDLAPGYNTADDGEYYTPAENRFPRDGKTYEPAFLLTGEKPRPGEDYRKALGRILPTHIQFARTAVNIVFGKLMVVGLVEPYDGFDLLRLDPKNPPPAPWTIQPANPELLQALAEDFRSHDFSIQREIKTIMKSNAYQLSTSFPGEWKETYVPYYARRFARVLTGPETADAIAKATGVGYGVRQGGTTRNYVKELMSPQDLKAEGRGGPSESSELYAFMQSYYQSERTTPPGDRNVTSPVQAMMMMSSGIITRRVSPEGKTRVADLLKSGKSDNEMVDELFLSSLSRPPNSGELEVAKRLIKDKGKDLGLERVEWVLLNSPEFLLNH